MFGRRDKRRVARDAEETRVDREDEPGRRGEYARQVTRAVMTLIGAAAAGLVIWLATQIGDDSTGGYWAVYGLLAAAGLALALSQLLGGWTKWGWPKISAAVFVLGFLPVLVAGGWLLLAHQPDGASFRSDALSWANDIGLGGLFEDLREYLPVIAFAIGLVFGFTFDTRGPRVREAPVVEERRRDVEPVPVEERRVADEPVTAERRTAAEHREPVPDDGDRVEADRPVTHRTER
jgi:hypothetical protein